MLDWPRADILPSRSIFGRVLTGMGVVQRMGSVSVDAEDR